MREQQIELMNEYLSELEKASDKAERLYRIIEGEKNTLPNIINMILTSILLVVVVYAVIDGRYISKEVKIVETCYGKTNR